MLMVGVVFVFFILLADMSGCNPRNIRVEECADSAVLTGVVSEMKHIDAVQDKKYALNAYQKKVFQNNKNIYFFRFSGTLKIGRLYFDSFYVESPVPILAEDITGKQIRITYRRVCLKNIFYSAGIEAWRDGGLSFVSLNKNPVLKIEKIEIIN